MITTPSQYDFVTQDSLARFTINGQIAPLRSDDSIRGEDIAFITEASAERVFTLDCMYGASSQPTRYLRTLYGTIDATTINNVRSEIYNNASNLDASGTYHCWTKEGDAGGTRKDLGDVWEDNYSLDWVKLIEKLAYGKTFEKSDVSTPVLQSDDDLTKSHILSLFGDLAKIKNCFALESCGSPDYYADTDEDVNQVGSAVRLFPSGITSQCGYFVVKYDSPPSRGNNYAGSRWVTNSTVANISYYCPYADTLDAHPIYMGYAYKNSASGTNPNRGTPYDWVHKVYKASPIRATKNGDWFNWSVNIHSVKDWLKVNFDEISYGNLTGAENTKVYRIQGNIDSFLIDAHIGSRTRWN